MQAPAATEEERRNLNLSEISTSCMKEIGVTKEEYDNLIRDKDLSKVEPCFIGCFMKAMKMVNVFYKLLYLQNNTLKDTENGQSAVS